MSQDAPADRGMNLSTVLPFLAPFLGNLDVTVGGRKIHVGPFAVELINDLADGKIEGPEGRRLAIVALSVAAPLMEREIVIGGRSYDLAPSVHRLSTLLEDGNLSASDIRELVPLLLAAAMASHAVVGQAQAVGPIVVPHESPAPQPVPTPAPTAPTTGGHSVEQLKVVRIVAKLTGIFDRRNQPVTPDPLPGVLRGDNWDNGFIGHSDATLILSDGTEVGPVDPRWEQLNHWAPNGNPVFPYYEYNGQLTDIRHGDHGSEFVDPTSFEDDKGCTVSWGVDTPEPHNTQAQFRFGYMYRDFDGSYVESGLIGQGNVPGGAPFNIK